MATVSHEPPVRDPFCVSLSESAQVGELRRLSVHLARAVGLNEVACGQVAIIATELATNAIRHARGGDVIVRSLRRCDPTDSSPDGVEILAIDHGPGMANVSAAMRDGFSTAGSAGNGLGAVRRLATEWDIFTQANRGTVIVARLYGNSMGTPDPPHPWVCGVVSLPKPDEEECGDGWSIIQHTDGRLVILLVDGLGHGPLAARASQMAIRLFRDNIGLPSYRIIEAIHAGLRSTRGAAAAVAELPPSKNELRFTGVGNIAASIVTEGTQRSMVSHSGTAGVEARSIHEFTYPWSPASLLLMHTDGVATHWNVAQYPGLRFKHPSIIAGVLFRDFRRLRDDATLLVLRAATTPAGAAA